MYKKIRRSLALYLFLIPPLTGLASAEPNVVVSIKPIHSLVSAVMRGAAEPMLILSGFESPHHYSLRPSDRKRLAEADIVFRVSPSLETFLNKPLAIVDEKTRVVSLIESSGLHKLTFRNTELGTHTDDAHSHETAKEHEGHEHSSGSLDPHIWLDVDNAIALTKTTSEVLIKLDPANKVIYQDNTRNVTKRLQALKQELIELAQPLQDKAFVVFHDAYGYLSESLNIKAAAAIQKTEGRMPGAKRMDQLIDIIKSTNTQCVFAEPDANSRVVQSLAKSSGVKTGVLDIIGVQLAPGPDAYFVMMRNLLQSLRKCLL